MQNVVSSTLFISKTILKFLLEYDTSKAMYQGD